MTDTDWMEIKCTCGDPAAIGVVHSTTRPCHYAHVDLVYTSEKRVEETAKCKHEWVGLPSDKEILDMSKDAWGRAMMSYGRDDHCSFYVAFARAVETYLKEKNHG